MKKILQIIMLFILISNFVMSQDDKYLEQEFKITDFLIKKAENIKDKSGITMIFDVDMKYPLESYSRKTYSLQYVIKTIDNKIIFEDKENSIKITPKKDFWNDKIAKEDDIKIFIPYENLQIESGNHQAIIEFNIEAPEKNFGIIHTVKLNLQKPDLFEASEQQFSITNFTVKAKDTKLNLEGITIQFDCNLKFAGHQIKGVYKNTNMANYIFNIKLLDKNNLEPVNYFQNKYIEKKITADKTNNQITIFIPYNQILLQSGKYNMEVIAEVQDEAAYLNIRELKKTTITYNQPDVYLTTFTTEYASVVYGQYDPSALVVRIFSNPDKNKGKGWPDVYWGIKVGEMYVYESPISKNSFTAPKGSCTFTVTNGESVKFVIADYDLFSFDDIIGIYTCKLGKGNFTGQEKILSMGKIERLEYTIVKQSLPELDQKKINVRKIKNEGVSGQEIELVYKFTNIPEGDKITIIPIIKSDTSITLLENYKILSENAFDIDRNNSNGSIRLFVPDFLLPDGCSFGFDFKLNYLNFRFTPIISTDKFKLTELDDIKLTIKKIEEVQVIDIHGISINIQADIPKMYRENRPRNNLIMQPKFVPTSILNQHIYMLTKNLQKVTELVYLTNDNFNIFIPYYAFESINTESFVLQLNITGENKNTLGKNNLNFTLKHPEIKKIRITDVKFKNKNQEYDSFFWKLQFNTKPAIEAPSISSNNSCEWENLDITLSSYLDDKFQFSIIGKNKFGLATELYTEKLKIKELNKGKALKLSGNSQIKKIRIKSQ